MKLLLYSHFFTPSVGGVETSILSLARGLCNLRHDNGAHEFEVTLVTQTASQYFDDSTLPFVVVRQPKLLRLSRLIRTADVIHVAGPAILPLLLAKAARKPVVIEHHGYQAICPNGLLVHIPDRAICPGYFQARNYSKCLQCRASEIGKPKALVDILTMVPRTLLTRKATSNVAISHHVLERHAIPGMRTIYYGVEDLHGEVKLPAKLTFAFVGRFVKEKGISVLLEASRLLEREGLEFQVQLIGDGPQRSELERIIADKQLKAVSITGYLTGSDLEDALRDVCAVVMPSIWEETAGLSAMEHMMRGKVVLASQIGGLGEIVGDSGMLFPMGDAVALAACMRTLLQDNSLIVSIGDRARNRAHRLFRLDRMIEDHARLYTSIC